MTDREKEFIRYQKQYLNLVNKITRLQLSGENPPEKLLKQAQEIWQKGEIPEEF
jgi:Txe/YoeB family toxin of Txe-Axe toxin-antitoxin module